MPDRALKLSLAALAVACGGSPALGEKGDECFRAQDCQEGLVCIELLCSDEVERLVSTLPPPAGPTPRLGVELQALPAVPASKPGEARTVGKDGK